MTSAQSLVQEGAELLVDDGHTLDAHYEAKEVAGDRDGAFPQATSEEENSWSYVRPAHLDIVSYYIETLCKEMEYPALVQRVAFEQIQGAACQRGSLMKYKCSLCSLAAINIAWKVCSGEISDEIFKTNRFDQLLDAFHRMVKEDPNFGPGFELVVHHKRKDHLKRLKAEVKLIEKIMLCSIHFDYTAIPCLKWCIRQDALSLEFLDAIISHGASNLLL
jgi:hypothetical protein